MSEIFKAIIIDDSIENCENLVEELTSEALNFEWIKVSSLKVLSNALDKEKFDIILYHKVIKELAISDVINVLRNKSIEIPTIFIYLEIDDALIDELINIGVKDYIPRNDKKRLNFAISKEIFSTRERLESIIQKDVLRKAKEEAETATILKSRFLANMSHEIRTPLTGLMGMIQLLRVTELDKTQKKYIEIAFKSSSTLLGVLNDVLDYSKIEANRIEIQEEKFNIKDIINEVTDLFSLSAFEKSLNMTSTIEKDVPEILMGDPFRLKQIINNLVGNAIKFSSRGFVQIKVSADANLENNCCKLRVSVIDSGIGISEKDHSTIFKPFNQGDVSTTRQFGGTGLGLAIAKNLAHLIKGEITLESKLGRGSNFTFEGLFKNIID